jgi:NADPH:quinone reductase-like Zn-dependent oxidoreductase
MSHGTISQIPSTIRAFAIDRFGEPGMLRTLPPPAIGADEILVRAHTAGGNPPTLGQDAAGVVAIQRSPGLEGAYHGE